jgi:hypothetical protein
MPVYETFAEEGEAVVETLSAVFEGFMGEGDPLREGKIGVST